MEWQKLLAYITESVDQELLLRNEYLVTENRILHQQIPGRVRLSDSERKTLATMGKSQASRHWKRLPLLGCRTPTLER